jgi:hypothetical protein
MDSESSMSSTTPSDTTTAVPLSAKSSNAAGGVSSDPLETAKWTQYLPQTFGIREAVRQSSYRWCVREGYVYVGGRKVDLSPHRQRHHSFVVMWLKLAIVLTTSFLFPMISFCVVPLLDLLLSFE